MQREKWKESAIVLLSYPGLLRCACWSKRDVRNGELKEKFGVIRFLASTFSARAQKEGIESKNLVKYYLGCHRMKPGSLNWFAGETELCFFGREAPSFQVISYKLLYKDDNLPSF